jgi:uncharacterized membrane protein YciS (DUF1049 family)
MNEYGLLVLVLVVFGVVLAICWLLLPLFLWRQVAILNHIEAAIATIARMIKDRK